MSTNHPLPISQHRRTKSSVLKSLLHKRTISTDAAVPTTNDFVTSNNYSAIPFLPQDHPHHKPLGERHHNQQSNPPASSRKPADWERNTRDEAGRGLHKKTLSSISLKSLAGKDTEKAHKSKDPRPSKPKKTKSSTNLVNLLSRPKSSKNLRKQAEDDDDLDQKDKENRNPPSTPVDRVPTPPIYAQYSSEHLAKQRLEGDFLEDEIDLYTPRTYFPGNQRNFYEGPGIQPSLISREDGSQRPRSSYLPSNFSLQDLTRRVSGGSRHSAEFVRRISGAGRPSMERKVTASSMQSEKTPPSRSQKALAALSSFGTKAKAPDVERGATFDDKDIEKEFEAMLDRRNIPEHQRGKMRNLAVSMKRDFVKQDWAETAAAKNGRLGTNSSDSSADATTGTHDIPEVKSKRPRSRTFTLSRSSTKEPPSQTKKSKGGSTFGLHSRSNSTETLRDSGKSLTSSGAAVAQNLLAKAKSQTPNDFVSYLRKVTKPELVEVGKLHKLRLLLRNETVAWTDDFITQGGMEEIVGLLHRIMEVEWREEHEDALLHEVLLCLKALSTTALALDHLNNFQSTLFPALLHMLFDEEKKGPSEFTTRNIITSLLFTYLKMAPLLERPQRARILLSYLRDQEPCESERPIEFVLDMRRDRPYRVWCKEVVSVTKEVFWIFLHNLNVISLPGARQSDGDDNTSQDAARSTAVSSTSKDFDASNPHHVYMIKHFPQELPPVPAAPYVGGVEWDATNYLASHLDLINGILACLPTKQDRCALREKLLVSGWEKCMGSTLRLCKEKFYGGVHAGLRCWVAAAAEDGWETRDVRCGPSVEARCVVRTSPRKKPAQEAPKIDMKLDFLGEGDPKKAADSQDWL